ncbi:MAG TPA: GNAT family N-acetyltransferase [Solirubrobacteraceae bacterium]|nr:GNAT family N-acetyltransferase [Solirubrobacteraceae bacterium]
MQFTVTRDATAFRDVVWPLLESRVQNNLLATVLIGVLAGDYDRVDRYFAYRLDQGGRAVTAAIRTAPFPLLCSTLGEAEAGPLLDAWMAVDPELPGANALAGTATTIAGQWSRRTGGRVEADRATAMHAIDAVMDPPHVPPGALRAARPDERELLLTWWTEFAQETGEAFADRTLTERHIDARLATRGAWLWDDHGPVCLVAAGPPVAGIPRLGPVYTPPALRGRGYAGMAVAEVSRALLGRGAPQVVLYTDLANPTANKIYAQVGYRHIGVWTQYRFGR